MESRSIFLQTEDGVRLSVKLLTAGRPQAVIIAPGYFQSKETRTFRDMAARLAEYFDVIVLDFRGHGRSSGFYTFTVQEVKDLRTVVDFVKKGYERVGIVGFSLGAATAILYAAERQDLGSLVLVSAPAAFHRIEMKFWTLESILTGWRSFAEGGGVRPGNIFLKKHSPIDVIGSIRTIPMLFIHGTPDPIVDIHHSHELYERAVVEKKRFEVIEKGGHGEEVFRRFPDRFIQLVAGWFRETLA